MRAAVYIRKSREDRGKPALRLEAQRRMLPERAARRGWTVVMVEDDGFASGQDQAKLTGLQRIISAIKRRRVDVVMAIELTRFSRDESGVQFGQFVEMCRSNSVQLATADQVYDPDEGLQWFHLHISAGLSAMEMRLIKRRMKEGRDEARKQGRWGGGHPPLGYKMGLGGLELSDASSTVVRVISLALKNSAGVVARKTGVPVGTVRRILTPRRLNFYAGHQDDGTGNLIEAKWPAIIDRELVAQVLQAKGNRNSRGGKSTRAIHLLTGLGILRCGHCGRSLKTWRDYNRNPRTGEHYDRPTYYGCNSRAEAVTACPGRRLIQARTLEKRVIADVEKRLSNRDLLMRADAAYHHSLRKSDGGDLSAELERLTVAKGRLVRAVAEGALSFEDVRAERDRIDGQIYELESEQQETAAGLVSPDLIPRRIALGVLSFEEKREYLVSCLKGIEVKLPHVHLDYQFAVLESGKSRVRLQVTRQEKKAS